MIPVKNIYYMLAYAFSTLRSRGFASIEAEEFECAGDLLATILARGINQQIKRGLQKGYVPATEATSTPRGKIGVSASIKQNSAIKGLLVCSFDEFTANVYLNQILKTAGLKLMRAPLSPSAKKKLKRALVYLEGIDALDEKSISWKQRYDRNSLTYQLLISVCYMVIKGMVHTENDGSFKAEAFDEEIMSHLYEKFVLEYFRAEHADTVFASAPFVPWALDDENGHFLPAMRTDITLVAKKGPVRRVLIIDTKYYTHTMQTRFDKRTIHSGNLYQVFAYVKNADKNLSREGVSHEVSGMLLYARTDEDVQPDETCLMSGIVISVKTLDLSKPFSEIRAALDAIAHALLAPQLSNNIV